MPQPRSTGIASRRDDRHAGQGPDLTCGRSQASRRTRFTCWRLEAPHFAACKPAPCRSTRRRGTRKATRCHAARTGVSISSSTWPPLRLIWCRHSGMLRAGPYATDSTRFAGRLQDAAGSSGSAAIPGSPLYGRLLTRLTAREPGRLPRPLPGQIQPPAVLLSVRRERKKTCNVSDVALDPGSCTHASPAPLRRSAGAFSLRVGTHASS
jgi:hypothetical protein